jgi:hypothetical protein
MAVERIADTAVEEVPATALGLPEVEFNLTTPRQFDLRHPLIGVQLLRQIRRSTDFHVPILPLQEAILSLLQEHRLTPISDQCLKQMERIVSRIKIQVQIMTELMSQPPLPHHII